MEKAKGRHRMIVLKSFYGYTHTEPNEGLQTIGQQPTKPLEWARSASLVCPITTNWNFFELGMVECM